MANVGTLVFSDDKRTYAEGQIKTRTLKMNVGLLPTFNPNDPKSKPVNSREPAFRVVEATQHGEVEIGSAWIKITNKPGADSDGMEYLSMSLDDPSFPDVLQISAFPDKKDKLVYNVAWNRPRARAS